MLHRPEVRGLELAAVEKQTRLFAGIGAELIVLAASTGREGHEGLRSWTRGAGRNRPRRWHW